MVYLSSYYKIKKQNSVKLPKILTLGLVATGSLAGVLAAANTTPQTQPLPPILGQVSTTIVLPGDKTTSFDTVFATQAANVVHAASTTAPSTITHTPTTDNTVAVAPPVITTIYEDGKAYPNLIYKPLLTPNDPGATQWWTNLTGLHAAWSSSTGTSNVVIAIIDSGVALAHEEFAGRWYVNSREALNGIDDDGNGLIDDTTGWDYVNNDRLPQAGQSNPNGSGTAHGSFVAGIAAANGNNSRGLAGVNWGAKILPIQALSDNGTGTTLAVANGVRYAADQGAAVINLSLGSEQEDTYLRQAIHYAIGKGSIVVAAAGNDGCDCMLYPARYPEVVAVGALATDGNPAGFSSFGSSLDIMAPGSSMYTTTWSAGAPANAYGYAAGTSLAAPYISGLLALGRSVQPNASWGEIIATMTSRLDHRGLTEASPRSNQIGYGNVRADGFVGRLVTSASPLQRYSFTPLSTADVLGSGRLYQCEAGEYPTMQLSQLTRGNEIRFTGSDLERYSASVTGWTILNRGSVCAGLPFDTPQFTRSINLFGELLNITTKQ